MPQTTITMLTDYALAAVVAVLGVLLIRRGKNAPPMRLWGWAFVALAAAGVLGGSWHGFERSLDRGTLGWLWLANEWAIGLFGLAAVAATTVAAFAGRVRQAILAIAVVGFIVFAAWTFAHDEFRHVVRLNLAVMAYVLFVHGTALRRSAATPWIVGGIAVSAAAVAVQASSLALGPLNHNDLFHLVQLAAMALLFAGALRLRQAATA